MAAFLLFSSFVLNRLVPLASAIALAAVTLVAGQGAPQGDVERLLADRFRFTGPEIDQVRRGEAVARMLPVENAADVGVVAAVRVPGDASRLEAWLKDVAGFRRAAELGLARRISDPPGIADFAELTLDAAELSALRDCTPGNCDLRLGDQGIRRFQTEIDWTAADAGRRANLLMRERMLGLTSAYLAGGDRALGEYHHERTPRAAAEDSAHVLRQAAALHDLTPALAAYLAGFPAASLAGSESFLYWGKGSVGPEASITLHHLVSYRPGGGRVFVVDKQVYASRYVDAGMVVISLWPAADGAGFYAVAGARARSSMLGGMAARLVRGRVESATRETATMYLNWIRASMGAGRHQAR